MLDFFDYLYIVCVSVLRTMIIFICAYLLFNLFMYNRSLGISIADNMQIPYDLCLTVTSLGFVNNIMVIFTIFDLIILGIVINQLSKYRITHRLFNHFSYFMGF